MLNNKGGFTLIELVMIIIVLGILAAVAIPKYIDLKSDAEDASIRGLYGHITSAYGISIASKKANPSLSDVNGNLTASDTGTLDYVAGASSVKQISLVSGDNYIVGGNKKASFIVTVSSGLVTAIGGLKFY